MAVIITTGDANRLAEMEGIEVVESKDSSMAALNLTCPTGYEDRQIYKTQPEALPDNNEIWRGRGKRRKSICK